MTSKPQVEQLYHQAFQLYQESQLNEARRIHDALRGLAPGGVHDALLTGLSSFRGQRYEEALLSYEQAIRLGGGPLYAGYALKSLALEKLGRFEEAVAACDDGIARAPGNLFLYEVKAILLLILHRIAEALPVYDDILEGRPRAVEILLFKSLALFLLGRPAQGRSVQEHLLQLLPDASKSPAFKDNMRTHLAQYEELVDDYVAASPLQADAWYCTGLIALMGTSAAEVTDEALEAFEEALRLDPAHAFAWNGKGTVLLSRGLFWEAAVAYAHAAELLPTVKGFSRNREKAARAAEGGVSTGPFAGAHKQQGVTGGRPAPRFSDGEVPSQQLLQQLLDEERFDEALVVCEQLVSVARQGRGGINLAASLWLKARTLLDLDRCGEAVDAYRELLQLDPSLRPAWIELGELLFHEQRYDEALDALDTLLGWEEENGALYEKKASLLLLLGRDEEGLECASRAHALDPTNDLVYMILATALGNLGRHGEALRLCDEAQQAVDEESRAFPMLFLCKADALTALGRPLESLPVFDEALRLELEWRRWQMDEEGALFEGVFFAGLVGDVQGLILSGMGNAWLVLGEYAKALEHYDRALSLGPNEEIEANRLHAMAALHGSPPPSPERVLALQAAQASAVLVPDRADTVLIPGQMHLPGAKKRVRDRVEKALLFAASLVMLGLAAVPLLRLDPGHFFRSLPLTLVVLFDVIAGVLYPVYCWLGWSGPANEATAATPLAAGFSRWPRVSRSAQRFRRAVVFGGTYLGLSVAALLVLEMNGDIPLYDRVTPVLLALWVILLLVHLAVLLILFAWQGVGGRAQTRG